MQPDGQRYGRLKSSDGEVNPAYDFEQLQTPVHKYLFPSPRSSLVPTFPPQLPSKRPQQISRIHVDLPLFLHAKNSNQSKSTVDPVEKLMLQHVAKYLCNNGVALEGKVFTVKYRKGPEMEA
jgi:hypothetical protein